MNHVRKKTKRFVTLIEMMIVMFLIAMIIGVVGYNYQGSLEKGKKFKSTAGIAKLETVLMMHLAENPGAVTQISQWRDWVANSLLVKNASDLQKDGWGQDYIVSLDNNGILLIADSRGNTNR